MSRNLLKIDGSLHTLKRSRFLNVQQLLEKSSNESIDQIASQTAATSNNDPADAQRSNDGPETVASFHQAHIPKRAIDT